MSTTVQSEKSASNPFEPQHRALSIRRQVVTWLSIVLTGLFTILAAGFLLYLIFFIAREGLAYLNLDFFTQPQTQLEALGEALRPRLLVHSLLLGLPR